MIVQKDIRQLKIPDRGINSFLKTEVAVVQRFAEVVLGRPSTDCRHFGICKIEIADTTKRFRPQLEVCNCKKCILAIASFVEDDFFELAFLKSHISAALFEKHFEGGFFIIEEDFFVSKRLFGIPFWILKGRYNTKVSKDLIVVKFKI